MKFLVIGSGGREHALVRKISQSEHVTKVYVIKGNDGMKEDAEIIDINENDHENILSFIQQNDIDYCVIGPEQPLIDGLADLLKAHGIKVFGPNQKAAMMEGSKAFAKEIMDKYEIPTAKYAVMTSKSEALDYLKDHTAPIVIKYDGLAAGKGVIVAMTDEEAVAAINHFYEDDNCNVVIEEYLEGEEFSLMVMVNDDFCIPFDTIAQDHKRAFDGDTGPNTGGMGAYCPVDQISQSIIETTVETIVHPVVKGMYEEGLDYYGVLYVGAIITKDGPKVIEFNARFGDPEAQVLLTRLQTDFVDLLNALENKEPLKLNWHDGYVCGVVLASEGYPDCYDKGHTLKDFKPDMHYYSAALKKSENGYMTDGGRVLLAVGTGTSLKEATDEAYEYAKKIQCSQLFFRNDIAHKGLI